MMVIPTFPLDCAVAAPPPNPALHETEPRQQTSLSAVFHRMTAEAPAWPDAILPAGPQLLGFAEPVVDVPPVETFLPRPEDALASTAAERLEIAALEVAPQELPEPLKIAPPEAAPPKPVAKLDPIPARVCDLPPAPVPPPSVPSDRPQNLVGRLGRRPAEVSPAPQDHVAPSASASSGERVGRPSPPRNRRLYRRVKLPADIEIGGVPRMLIDVSIGGFAATGVPQIEPNTMVPVTIRLTIDGIEVGTQLDARIVYVTQGRSSGRFIDLSPSQMAFLRYIVTWRGESIGAVGTTTLLDAIAGGVERGFPMRMGHHADSAPKSRWWVGLIGRKINPPR
jgi:hypothetical protein